jgi:hypothetical protein
MSHLISSSALLNVIAPEKNNKGAEFTVTSKKTGVEYTYSISRKEFKGKWYTHIRVEKQYQKFTYLGSYFKGKLFHKGQVIKTPAALAIAHVLGAVENGHITKLDQLMELRHTGNCLRCGRELTDSNSIDRGLGPTCASLV